ncbi:magnesium and cobalt transport protein CorA [Roseomonas sp. CCTCC AB2023176]|uniref:magnesium and cobalt transport protein CorA n=1 Tax=Roseomonas sp. CCTCC AB2023176 TaxID=3342640 RepID=UPI0035D72BF2
MSLLSETRPHPAKRLPSRPAPPLPSPATGGATHGPPHSPGKPPGAEAHDAASHRGVIACQAYSHGRAVAQIPIEQAGDWSRRPDHMVWVGLFEPAGPLLAEVQHQFNLHDLAVEDAAKPHQRPKVETYGDSLFIVARTAQMMGGKIAFGETHLFVGDGYVVTVRHGPSSSYAAVRARCESCPATLSHGQDYILYAILDFIVDNYTPVLESIAEEAEAIEDRVLAGSLTQTDVERLYTLRRDLLRLKNAVGPLGAVVRRLEHAPIFSRDPAMLPFLRDVDDHVRQCQEEIETLREVLAFAFEASLLTGQSQQTEVSRRLAAWAAILAVPTAIAGIYGMNFEYMPELKWDGAYFAVLAAIVAICATLYWRFRRAGWL